jgi:hypothetical protein
MLREAGKRDLDALRAFLTVFHARLPRTALRYAIERMDPAERKKWMKKMHTTPNVNRLRKDSVTEKQNFRPAYIRAWP